MSNNKLVKPISIAISTAVVSLAAAGSVSAADASPFAMNELSSGYMQLAEGKCGGDMKKKMGKDGKCGGDKKAMDKHAKEGKCGEGKGKKEGKCGEGKCGSDKMKKDMGKEGKCGEGKCGGDKK